MSTHVHGEVGLHMALAALTAAVMTVTILMLKAPARAAKASPEDHALETVRS